MGQMIPKQPLIIIIWIYQEMMVWMSRKSICIFTSAKNERYLMSDAQVALKIFERYLSANKKDHDLLSAT
jgi:hypothetical protein